MYVMEIEGGVPLKGEINIAGAKNAALPLIAASILTDEDVILENVPDLVDVQTLLKLLKNLGVKVEYADHKLKLNASKLFNTVGDYDYVKKMRASILILGPLVAKHGKAHVSFPGGCAIGVRPIDLHISGMKCLGASVDLNDGYIDAKAPAGGLQGAEIVFPIVSVTGTENIIMAAVLASGSTKIINAAVEPEVLDLIAMLNKMGAKISVDVMRNIFIEGSTSLRGVTHKVISDRIELGTYVLTTAITDGEVHIKGSGVTGLINQNLGLYHKIGINIDMIDEDHIFVKRSANGLNGVEVETSPYPGFPTDMQAQLMATVCLANNESFIKENIWESRFIHVPELCRMGANVSLIGKVAHIKPITEFKSAPVTATDLRASFSLIMAGLVAKGKTVVDRIYHLDRGYEHAEVKLSQCNARIKRVMKG